MALSQSASNFTSVTAIYTGDETAKDDNEENSMRVEVLEDGPHQVVYGRRRIIEIIFTNESDTKCQELLEFKVNDTKFSQLMTVDMAIPFIIDKLSKRVFLLFVMGQFLGKSTENVEFVFKNLTFIISFQINIIHFATLPELREETFLSLSRQHNMMRLNRLKSYKIIPGISTEIKNYPSTFNQWEIPPNLWQCYSNFLQQSYGNDNPIKRKLSVLYSEILENLTYQNYKRKFHTLLYMNEIEDTYALQRYGKDSVVMIRNGEYMAIYIQNVNQHKPFLIPGHTVLATVNPPYYNYYNNDTPMCFEGIIHSINQNILNLKFSNIFHLHSCSGVKFSVAFTPSRRVFRRLHDVVHKSLSVQGLGEAFLFPAGPPEYRAPKMIITSLDEMVAADPANGFDLNVNEDDVGSPSRRPAVVVENIEWFHLDLNNEQKSAVINILKAEGRRLPYIIYGPPGTGKTRTLTETIIQVYINFPDSKILVCAPTNNSIEMILNHLVNSQKINPTSMKCLISYSYLNSSSYRNNHSSYCVLPVFNLDLKQKNTMLIHDILELRVILSTIGTADVLKGIRNNRGTFTHIFLDEAGQMTEPITLHALCMTMCDPNGDKGQVIMAGDPKQLGPVVRSNIAKTCGLGKSLLARYTDLPPYKRYITVFPEYNGYNPKTITHLIRNYRSLPEIVSVFSDLFYESLVVATKTDDDEEERTFLNNLTRNPHWGDSYPKGPVIVHGIMGKECRNSDNPSWYNPYEVVQIQIYLNKLRNAGIDINNVGIITPYTSQVTLINRTLVGYNHKPKTGTVDLFQGREEMVIIVSLVRSVNSSSSQRSMGILGQAERINVTISRARALVIIIGNPETMYANEYMRKILQRAVDENNYIGCNPMCILKDGREP